MNWQLNIENNTDSVLNIGLLDSSYPGKPIEIVSINGYDYVDVPYVANYTTGDTFSVIIGGTTHTITLTGNDTPAEVAVLLTELGKGFWNVETIDASTNRFKFLPSGADLLTTLTYTAVAPPAVGWTAQTSGTVQAIYATFFIDANTGWACGSNGTILKTANGGTTWTAQVSGTINPLGSVFFLDANNGWIAGQAGTILYTTNGGTNWTAGTSGTIQNVYDVWFIDANNGWAVGHNGLIIASVDGGVNWGDFGTGTTPNALYSILQEGSIPQLITCGTGGVILGYDGSNWNVIASGTTDFLFKISNPVYAGGKLWISGVNGTTLNGTILYSSDGGASWGAQVSGSTEILFGISFVDANNGFACGTNGEILKTTDGGTNWTTLTSGTTENLHDVYFVNANVGWVVGKIGMILYTNSAGE